MTNQPFITAIIPTLNEEKHIKNCLESTLDHCSHPKDLMEVFIIDGGSSDKTVEIVDSLKEKYKNIKLINNPKKIQSAAMNIGIKQADSRTSIIMRLDAHSEYPAGFIDSCIHAIETIDADSIVVAMDSIGKKCFQKGVAYAQNSPVGVGNSPHRLGWKSGYVDHGHHACFRKEVFDRAGLYDESFRHNEDAELDYRINSSGGKIYLDSAIRINYYPRDTIKGLALQSFYYGLGRAKNIVKHKSFPRLRQLIPPIFFLFEISALILSFFDWRALVPLSAYIALMLTVAIYGTIREKGLCVLTSAVAFIVIHNTWAVGFFYGLLKKGLESLKHR